LKIFITEHNLKHFIKFNRKSFKTIIFHSKFMIVLQNYKSSYKSIISKTNLRSCSCQKKLFKSEINSLMRQTCCKIQINCFAWTPFSINNDDDKLHCWWFSIDMWMINIASDYEILLTVDIVSLSAILNCENLIWCVKSVDLVWCEFVGDYLLGI